MSNDTKNSRADLPNAPLRPDREPPDTEPLGSDEEVEETDEETDDDIDDDLSGLDKTLADSFPASDPPQAP